MNRIYLIGASQEARSISNVLFDANPLAEVEILVERGHGEVGTMFHGLHVFGYTEALLELPVIASLVFADPDPKQRASAHGWVEQARSKGRVWPIRSIKAGTAMVASSVKLGTGSVVLPGAIVMDGAEIGSYVMVGPGVIVGAEARVGDYSTLQAGSVLGAKAYVGRGGLCGLGAVVAANRKVGAWSAVSDGYHLKRDLAPGKMI